jgi:antitoxin component YwqK of YwqJK toxin-antitoxin module
MNIRIYITVCLLTLSLFANCQIDSQLNKTDQQGKKQGHWIKYYSNESIMYDGYFKDDHPIGEFKRYFEDKSLKSLLIYSPDGKSAIATIYHPNGFISSKGFYVDQMKEGKWQFYSSEINGYLISEEYYSKNKRNGLSVKYYPDSTIAERITYVNDLKHGEFLQFYPSGKTCLKTNYQDGKINGKFEVWFENGAVELTGVYKNDSRDGDWTIFAKDGSVKYKLEYKEGITRDRQMEIDKSEFLDSLEINKGKIADPEKTGILKK